ncbi:hypothetical protein [Caudoviricetes sp.]|nr:hypothetical protein [Caudoviricetes sp.]
MYTNGNSLYQNGTISVEDRLEVLEAQTIQQWGEFSKKLEEYLMKSQQQHDALKQNIVQLEQSVLSAIKALQDCLVG